MTENTITYPSDWDERRRQIIGQQDGRCAACSERRDPDELHVHHITPVSDGGGHSLQNLRALCPHCHAQEHGRPLCAKCHLFGDRELWIIDDTGASLINLCDRHRDGLRQQIERVGRERCFRCGATDARHSVAYTEGSICPRCREKLLTASLNGEVIGDE